MQALVRRSRFVPKGHAHTLSAALHAAVAGSSAAFMMLAVVALEQVKVKGEAWIGVCVGFS